MKKALLLLGFIFLLYACNQNEQRNTEEDAQGEEVVPEEITIDKAGRIDASEMTTEGIDGGVNVWSDMDSRTFAFGLEDGDSVWLVKRLGEGIYIKAEEGEGWVEEKYVDED